MDVKKLTPVKTTDRKALGIRAGDTVRVHQKIVEKGKTRIQIYEGLVIATKHGTEIGATFTVRAVMSQIGVEKTFPLYSPLIDKIEIIRRSKVRRAKLYYIRDRASREIRRSLRNMISVNLSAGGKEEEVIATEVEDTTNEAPIEANPAAEPKAE
ncbi:50S ribosomal protein L19 [Patescibacteria group bacterium]|nr:50S ribosomal protein L19 [Patescibacteria group bacterium]